MALCHNLGSPAIVGDLSGMYELPRGDCPHWPAPVKVVKRPGLRALSHGLEPLQLGGGSQVWELSLIHI